MESPLIQTEAPVQPMDISINNENPQDLLDVKPQVTIVTNESTLSTQLNESQHNQSQVIVNIEVSNISIASDLQVQNNSSNGLLQPSQAQIQQEFVQPQSAQGNDNSQKLNGMMINIVKPNDEKRTDGEEGENTSPASRLKDRSPHLKLLAVSTESTLQPESANTSNTQEEDSNNLNPNVTLNVGNFANMKKCYSQAEIPAVSGNYGDTQTLKPATGIKRINSVNNFDAPKSPEESKQEPVSASQKQKISMNDFTKITSLGRGSYAEVFLVKKNSNGKLYALKALDKNFMLKEKKQYQAHVEKEVLLKMNHPNIIKLFSSFQDDLKLYFALEYVNGGEFSDYLRVQGKLPKEQVIFFAAEIINILEYIHIFGIAHRDMKPENILLTQEGHLKCIDFGTAKFLASDKRTAELYQKKDQPTAEESLSMSTSNNSSKRNHRSTFVGTPQYVSPEMLEGSDCGAAADLWSLGCMLYLMASGQYPFADTNEYLIFQKIKNVTLKFPDDMDADVKDLIQKLLVKDPMMRLGAGIKGPENNYDMLKAHPLFKNIDFSTIHEQKPPIAEVASPHKKKSHDLNSNDFGSPILTQPNRKHYNSDDLTKVEPKVEFPTDKAVKVVLSGLVLKKCGWLFYKPRQLILNSKPKLVYYDPDTNQLKGEVLLAPTTKAELESKTRFVITAPNKKYFFKEMEHSAEKWVELINNTVTQLYAKK